MKSNTQFSLGSLMTRSQGFTPQPTTTDEVAPQRKVDQVFLPPSPDDHCPSRYNFHLSTEHRQRRRNSCALPRCFQWRTEQESNGAWGGVDPACQNRFLPPSICLHCTCPVHDPELVEMYRWSRMCWSKVIGSSYSRSIDTGLNELHRITGEGSDHLCAVPLLNQLVLHYFRIIALTSSFFLFLLFLKIFLVY